MNLFKRVALVGLALVAGCGYNTIQTYDEQVSAAAADDKRESGLGRPRR